MYASTHSDAAQTAAKYGINQQEAASATDKADRSVQQNAVDIADTAVHAEVSAGPSVAIAKPQHAGADNSAETGAAPIAEKLTGLSIASLRLSHSQHSLQTLFAERGFASELPDPCTVY